MVLKVKQQASLVGGASNRLWSSQRKFKNCIKLKKKYYWKIMNQAAFYQRVNQMQRNDAEKVTREEHLEWRLDGHDTLLDVGCGSGDVLMDFIYPQLPKNFGLLMGTDISTKMVEFASQNYKQDERVKFGVLDIASKILPNELCEQFDHVTSFYCLHWVQNQRQAFYNIHKLLRREGGDCLLIFLASSPLYDIYKAFSQLPKWAPFMKDVDEFMSPLQYSKDPVKEVKQLLLEVGFTDCKVELRNRVHIFRNGEALKNSVKAVCPFMERIPVAEQQEFLNDLLQCVQKMQLHEIDANTKDYKFRSPYKLIVVYAKKSNAYFEGVIETKRSIKGLN